MSRPLRLIELTQYRNGIASLAGNLCLDFNIPRNWNMSSSLGNIMTKNEQAVERVATTRYVPSTVESIQDAMVSPSTAQYCDRAIQTGAARRTNQVQEESDGYASTRQGTKEGEDSSPISAAIFCNNGTRTELIHQPGKSILKKCGLSGNSSNRVGFGEMLATDIRNGEPISSTTTPRELSFQGHLHSGLCGCNKRKANKVWRATARRLARYAIAEADTRRIGGYRRVVWRRGLFAYLRSNGLNGNAERIGRHLVHTEDEEGGVTQSQSSTLFQPEDKSP